MTPEQEKWGAKESIDMATSTIAELRKAGGVDRFGAATSVLLLATVVSQLNVVTDSLARIESLLERR